MTTSPWAIAADIINPVPVDAFGVLGYQPTERQQAFHEATTFDVLYGGAAGGGKTKALLLDDIRDAVRYPGLRIGAFRRTYDELAESFFKELATIAFAEDLGARWIGTTHELRFPNRSVIRYRYLETILDATRRQGGEYQKITIDERTLIDPAAVSILVDERLRSGDRRLPVIGVRSSANPGGVGHAAVRSRFIEPTEYGAHSYADDQDRSVEFIPARVADNPHVDAGYVRRLDGIPDPARRAAMKDGNWDTFAGQVFAEWNHDRHVVRPFTLPVLWWRAAGIDHGYRAPWAVVWAALDQDRRMWVYRERYETEVGEHEQARRILADEALDIGAPVNLRAADPSMWAKKGEAEPIAAVYAAEGCAVVPAINDRLTGWQRLHSWLADGPACDHHRALGWETCPLLHVFESCTELIRTLPSLPYGPGEDADTHAEDHLPDGLRYLVMAVPPHAMEQLVVVHHEHKPSVLGTAIHADEAQSAAGSRWDDDEQPRREPSIGSMSF